MQSSPDACGILLVAKPAGVTSHDVVERIRSMDLARKQKVGHAGTLDPFATGLLLVLVGRATRFQRYLLALPKRYRVTARFGAASDSGDPDGQITETGARSDRATVEQCLGSLRGEIEQRVPMTSAVKVGGERLYRKARRGERIETPLRKVNVSEFELRSFDEVAQKAELDVECSSGTYVRQLVTDLGELCGAGAYCTALERTAIGPFELVNADEQRLVGLSEALSFLPERALTPDEGERVRNGVAVPADGGAGTQSPVRLTAGDELLAIARRDGDLLKPQTVVSVG
jgi:tRNA pseudouridine55 synthase